MKIFIKQLKRFWYLYKYNTKFNKYLFTHKCSPNTRYKRSRTQEVCTWCNELLNNDDLIAQSKWQILKTSWNLRKTKR